MLISKLVTMTRKKTDNPIDKVIADNLRLLRIKRGMTIEAAAAFSDVPHWGQIESLHKGAGKDVILKIATAFGLRCTDLYKEGSQSAVEPATTAGAALTAQEREYIDKLLSIFRTKDEDTISAITRNIDTLLRVPDKES